MRRIMRQVFIASTAAAVIAVGSAFMAGNVVAQSSAGQGRGTASTTVSSGTVVVNTPDFNAP